MASAEQGNSVWAWYGCRIQGSYSHNLTKALNMTSFKENQFLDACRTGNLAQAKQLVLEGVNMNCADSSKQVTALMYAIEYKQNKIIDWLISKPTVDVDRHNKWQNTALHYAARYSEDGILVAALGNRMRRETVNLKNKDRLTTVVKAIRWNSVNIRALQGLLSVQSVDFNDTNLLNVARLVYLVIWMSNSTNTFKQFNRAKAKKNPTFIFS